MNTEKSGIAALTAVLALARTLEMMGALHLDEFLDRLDLGAQALDQKGELEAAETLRSFSRGTKTAILLERQAGQA